MITKMAILFTVLIALSTTALDDMTTPNTYTSNSILTAAQLNEDNDSTRLPYNRLVDSIDNRFVRFSDLEDGDSALDSLRATRAAFTWMNADTIRGGSIGIGTYGGSSYLLDVLGATGNMRTKGSSATGSAGVWAFNDMTNGYVSMRIFGTNSSIGTFWGEDADSLACVFTSGVESFAIGTLEADRLVLGTNNTARLTLDGSASYVSTPGLFVCEKRSATVSSGTISGAAAGWIEITSENGATADTLTGMPTSTAGAICRLTIASGSGAIFIEDGSGAGAATWRLGANRTIGEYDVLTILYDGTDWLEVSFASN